MLSPQKVNGTLLTLMLIVMVIAFFRVYGGPNDVIKEQPRSVVEEKANVILAEIVTKGTAGGRIITVFKHEDKDTTIYFTSEGGLVINKK